MVPFLVQMTKEVFRQVEENPKLDGMWGLFNKDVEKANDDVKKVNECAKIASLMGIMVGLLGKLCHENKSLISTEQEDIKDMVNWCDLRSLLQQTENFMKDGEALKLKMRLKVKGKRFLSIINDEDNGIYLFRDYRNLTFGLIEFARFRASRIVSFSALANENKLSPLDDVNYDEEEKVFVQSFKIMTTQETQSVVCLADINDKGCYKTVGTLRSEIVSKDIKKIKKDFQTRNSSIRLVFHENHDCRMLVHGTSQRKMDEVTQRLKQTFDCSDTGVFQSSKLKLLSVSDKPFFDLIYHYGDEGIYYQGDGMAIFYEEILSAEDIDRNSGIVCAVTPALDKRGRSANSQPVEIPKGILDVVASSTLMENLVLSPPIDYGPEQLVSEGAISLTTEDLEKFISSSSDKDISDNLAAHLNIDSNTLEKPDEQTCRMVRCFSHCVRSSARTDVLKMMKRRLPAGTAGPLVAEDTLLRDMEYPVISNLAIALSGGEGWKEMASYLHMSSEKILYLDRARNPALEILGGLILMNVTVGQLYDILRACGLEVLAEKL